MKSLYLSIITAVLVFVMPAMVYALDAPPVEQTLVREGDYAVEMAKALKINAAKTEADAENALATLGIAPKFGWISDFPVTPDIVVQLQTSVGEAASAGKLPMSRENAGNALVTLNNRLGVAVTVAGQEITSEQPAVDQDEVDTYYTDEGPPVITYYAPPEDYAYLYAWDPYPFWCDGFFFPGFFILNDFDVDVGHHHGHHHWGDNDRDGSWAGHGRVTNHVVGSDSRHTAVLDPVSRTPVSRTGFRTFDRGSASRLAGRGYDRSSDVTDSRITNTREVGRELPASMCPGGVCRPRGGESHWWNRSSGSALYGRSSGSRGGFSGGGWGGGSRGSFSGGGGWGGGGSRR